MPVKYDANYYGIDEGLEEPLGISSMTLKLESTGGFVIDELGFNFSNDEIADMITGGNILVTNNSVSTPGVEWKFSSDGTQVEVYDVGNKSEIAILDVQ